jgi:hypothetical protein
LEKLCGSEPLLTVGCAVVGDRSSVMGGVHTGKKQIDNKLSTELDWRGSMINRIASAAEIMQHIDI